MVVFVVVVGEVYVYYVEVSFVEFVDGFNRVCFGVNGVDDGGVVEVVGRLECGIEL